MESAPGSSSSSAAGEPPFFRRAPFGAPALYSDLRCDSRDGGSLRPSNLSIFCVFAVIAGVQFAAAATSPWVALSTAVLLGLGGGVVPKRLGLRFDNPWLMVGLAMLGCLAGVLAAAPVMAEPQWVSALSPSAALFAGIARVLIGLR